MSEPTPTTVADAFGCAAGSDAPARILLSNETKTRCPICRHMAGAHDPERGGTCDTCHAVRSVVNALVDRMRAHGLDLTADPVDGPQEQEAGEESVEDEV